MRLFSDSDSVKKAAALNESAERLSRQTGQPVMSYEQFCENSPEPIERHWSSIMGSAVYDWLHVKRHVGYLAASISAPITLYCDTQDSKKEVVDDQLADYQSYLETISQQAARQTPEPQHGLAAVPAPPRNTIRAV